ncbi:MAG: hypothetical protein A2087_10000 [Spirochaetes bacterium GWD1_61_31]|nr:MAG: hypothetical protein A2Y37_01820 [Spirochaetes bacterium GWB1_60_80]OHD32748.1 MAG: hypothetical protein A2004_06690 [Spirochaetes bacterium GWC1_61_12]OHD40614.1 MAG: hypothetical protein A2087_10000 [Spirochaetes bacterium GWD1_61_31]OHD43886.1 MAG: hypothetical protein A2Y35_12350 [Spirochaetes bacterium GWE1_60_18]OHD59757.1 MAG: hypothetical protein A2Y32_02205 [Spirochaetes bacterium GWF1_60_12]HAP43521.1 ATPase V [Spirochaetaceae bacterium]
MMFTTPMKLLFASVLRDDAKPVADALLQLGVMDAISIKDLAGDLGVDVKAAAPDARTTQVGELRKRAEGFFQLADPPLALPDLERYRPDNAGAGPLDAAAIEQQLDRLAASMNEAREKQKAAQDELLRLKDMRAQIEAVGDLGSALPAAGSRSFLDFRAGSLPTSRLASLESNLSGLPAVILKGGAATGNSTSLLVISLKRDTQRLLDSLRREGWEESVAAGLAGQEKPEILRELAGKETALRAVQAARADELKRLLHGQADELRRSWAVLRVEELTNRVRAGFSTTERTILLSGWVPAARCQQVEQGIRQAASRGCYLEWLLPNGAETRGLAPPVAMSNPRPLWPFQRLVSNYATPEYGSIDPTPFVAVAYLCMFGLMFGDAGHGLVLVLVGLLGWLHARKHGKDRNLFTLILYCGGAAIVTGFLFGSIFGQKLLPALWFDYHGIIAGNGAAGNGAAGHGGSGAISSIYDILGLTVRFGIVVLGVGMALNWVNLIRQRRWFALLFNKAGFFGAWIYGAGVWVAFYFVGHAYKELPPLPLLALLLGLPSLALAFKAPLEFFHKKPGHAPRKFGPLTLLNFTLEWIVELLEIFSGYLANTLSFMRVAGLGIAHTSLMLAFAKIAAMLKPDGGLSLPGLVVLILGNALVIALEGLSAGIQSLRLNYYEFFSKYFNGTGRAYRPISLRSRD